LAGLSYGLSESKNTRWRRNAAKKEREKLTRWVLSSTPTPQGVGYLNSEVDRLAEAEGAAQERLWTLEDQINGLELATRSSPIWRPGDAACGRGAGSRTSP